MPARVEFDPLRVVSVYPNGTSWTADLSGTGNDLLAADLAEALVQRTHPLGSVGAKRTTVVYASCIRVMIAWLNGQGFTGGAADLPKGLMLSYWMSTSAHHVFYTRLLLQEVPGLREDLRTYVVGRAFKLKEPARPYQPYSETEFARLEAALVKAVEDARRRHGEVAALAALGPIPDAPAYLMSRSDQHVAWLMSQHGPMSYSDLPKYIPGQREGVGYGNTNATALRDALFPQMGTVWAFRMLFGIYSGIVPDGIRDMRLEDITKTGARTTLVSYMKNRTGPESVAISGKAVRLLERWLELSAPMRRFAEPQAAGAVWIFTVRRQPGDAGENRYVVVSPADRPESNKPARKAAAALGVLGDDGQPLEVNAARIRTTYHNLLSRKGWTGRITIDPNHSAQVEGDHYLTATTPAQRDAVEAIIEDGQADILRRARPAVVLNDEQLAELAEKHPQTVAALGLSDDTITELLSGDSDVFTASCSDLLSGLHGPAGKPCPARPWVCLLCPLALFLPRHAANLLRLKAFFARQSRQMTVEQFLAVFGPYADRLDNDILPRFDPAVLTAAASAVADDDTGLPLRPEEGTS
ncbi:hypothetical protein [Catenulispora subtropica]|uniref:Uncharacterized protein n=1 Tax=Catenulispora subtropica TaxID=450798 RepID=A0ABN2QWN5_9ACTN